MTDPITSPAPPGDDETSRCAACPAPPLPDEDACLAHAHPTLRATTLAAWAAGHQQLPAAGITVSADLLTEIFTAAPASDEGLEQLREVDFTRATFGAGARFDGATFGADARFDGATFGDHAVFDGATFGDHARFGSATFGDHARFGGATFGADAWFGSATFGADAVFGSATFGADAWFDGATFGAGAWFGAATFGDRAVFDGATFGAGARFDGATFGDRAGFGGATFGDLARFEGATFGRGGRVGPVLAQGAVSLAGLVLDSGVMVVAAQELQAPGLRLIGPCQLRVGWARVDLSEADCSAPTVLAPPSMADLEGLEVPTEWGADPRPRLLSLRGADVAGLACTDVDLTSCRFAGAHHLDALRMDGATGFAGPPRPRRWPPSRWQRWSSRGVLAEERQWRATRPRWPAWQPPSPLEPGEPDEPDEPVSPARVAGLYRALRKAREDAKDEPGAADFYYGEMEMRRHDPDRSRGERWILHAYWALAGYGLRASRAFTALAVVLAAGATALWTVGLGPALAGQPAADPVSFADVVLYTIATASPVGAGALGRTLTTAGEAIRIALRFTGPVLLGLALLALRARVKR